MNNISAIYPASSLQRGFIYHAQRFKNDIAYRVQVVHEYDVKLDIPKYLQAWNNCIAQYPILRTAFNWEEDLIQVIYEKAELKYQVHDLSELKTEQEKKNRFDDIKLRDINKQFDFTKPALFRVTIVMLTNIRSTVILTQHHCITDGWSDSVLLRSLHQHYEALIKEKPLSFDEDKTYLLAQDYISKNKDAAMNYWESVLSSSDGAGDIESLVEDKKKALQSKDNIVLNTSKIEIKGKFYSKLKHFCHKEGITMNIVFQFAWHKLLQVYSGRSSTVVGTTVSGRDLPISGIEGSVGLYINTLPLLVNWNNNNTIREQLFDIQTKMIEMNTYSFAYLSDLRKDKPLFQNLFIYENYPAVENDFKSLQTSVKSVVETIDYNFCVIAYDNHAEGTILLRFNRQLLSQKKADRYASSIAKIVQEVVSNPDARHKTLNILDPQEFKKIIYDWNETDTDFPRDKTIHELFQEQVVKTPSRIALVHGENNLTYRELNERSNQLARRIRSRFRDKSGHELRPDSLIAIYMSRTLEMVISVLAILKAGGAYVPIDPKYPLERVRYMLEDTEAAIVLTMRNQSTDSKIEWLFNKMLFVDMDEHFYKREDSSILKQTSNSTDLAYVIYTSGTTGKPKGVMIEHRSVVSRSSFYKKFYNVNSTQVTLFYRSFCFDGAIEDYLIPFLHGGKSIIYSTGHLELGSFVAAIKDYGVTKVCMPPQLFYQVIEFDQEFTSKLKNLTIGSDRLNFSLLRKYKIDCKVFNAYGPTECTNDSLIFSIAWDAPHSEIGDCCIGKSIDDSKSYVLSDDLAPLPVGAVGELYIGGAGLARGYLKQRELTSSAFVTNPFASDEDQKRGYTKLYRTGDLVKWLDSGNIEYIGRKDSQIKIRGYRIELGEIEHALSQIEGIRQCCVVAKEQLESNRYLVGYFVPEVNSKLLENDQILEELSTKLPEYMIPTTLVKLDAFPLTSNGKLDRENLPDPILDLRSNYVEPISKTEVESCKVWQELLCLDRVGLRDNFFKLGGNSILALQVSHRMSKITKGDVGVSDIFRYKTIEQILLRRSRKPPKSIAATSSNDTALSFAQERLWFIEQLEEGSNAYHVPMVFELKEDASIEGLKFAIGSIISRHEVLRSTIRLEKGSSRPVQSVKDFALSFEESEIRTLTECEALIKSEINRPFDLSNEYPIRVHFFLIEPRQRSFPNPLGMRVALINIHHIAFDGWSSAVFYRELDLFYTAFIEKKADLRPPPLDIQYKDYAVWQRAYLQGNVLHEQLNYWKGKLLGYQPLDLPTDYARARQVDYRGARESLIFSKETSLRLRSLAKACEASLHSTLLSTIYILLSKYTGQKDIVIGTAIANRQFKQTKDLIGFFVNMQVNRATLNESQNFKDLILQVQNDQIEAQQFQDLPFEKLVEELKTPRDTSRFPVFQVTFEVFNSQTEDASHSKLQFGRPMSIMEAYAVEKFDLSIGIDASTDQLVGEISFAKGLFKASTIRRMASCYLYLVKELVEQPLAPHTKLTLLDSAERHKMLLEGYGKESQYPKDKTIDQMFLESVERNVDKVALIYEGKQLTYAKLNELGNRLAESIQERFVKVLGQLPSPGTPVLLQAPRGFEVVVGILGVLKAGFSYVPIDPDFPKERLAFIVKDTGAKLILTQHHSNRRESLLPNLEELCIGVEEKPALEKYVPAKLMHDSRSIAYIIYTSGTAGRPKGVMVEHRSVINMVVDRLAEYQMKPDENTVLTSSISFDASVEQIFVPLFNGSQLTIIKKQTMLDPEECELFFNDNKITHLDTVPSFLGILDVSKLKYLRRIASGGEACTSDVVKRVTKYVDFFNEYGPTEATVIAASYKVSKGDEVHDPIPVGKPISNTKLLILGDNLEPLPVGVRGEIFIGGDCLARNYINPDRSTEENFIDNPFGEGKLYRTGDLAKWLEDGNLEFLGRKDKQIKLRGFRIELNEVEAALSAFVGIKHCSAIVWKDKSGLELNNQLVVYYVKDRNHPPIERSSLLEHLHGILPEYMVPNSLIEVESLPTTMSGKIDFAALPQVQYQTEENYVEPGSTLEMSLCKLWEKVLGRRKVGITDNFFLIGGNSILAVKLTQAMSTLLHRELKVADLFRLKTIRKILENQGSSESLVRLYHDNYNPIKDNLVFIPPGNAGAEVYQFLTEELKSNYNCIGIDNVNLHRNDKTDNINELAHKYLNEYEQEYDIESNTTLLGWSLGGKIALEMAGILETRGFNHIKIVLFDTVILEMNQVGKVDGRKDQVNSTNEESAEVIGMKYLNEFTLTLEAEKKLLDSKLSYSLVNSSVILFKAKQALDIDCDESSLQDITMMYMNAKSNGVDTIAKKVKVIGLDCNHFNILKTNLDILARHIEQEV